MPTGRHCKESCEGPRPTCADGINTVGCSSNDEASVSESVQRPATDTISTILSAITYLIMTTHWYCHECGDGPLVLAHTVGCPCCQHSKCSDCTVVTIQPKRHTHGNQAVASCSPATTQAAGDTTTSVSAASTPLSTYCVARGTIISAHSYDCMSSEPTDGEEVRRWTCCRCCGDNSYDYSPGCTDCNDHWRCSKCSVYAIKY